MAATAEPRRAVRPGRLSVDVTGTFNLVGVVLLYLTVAFAFPTLVAVGYRESPWPFLGAAAITAAAGLLLVAGTAGRQQIGMREGFLVVALVWALAPAFGALPYLFSGNSELSGVTDAYFEAMSGFSTTSSSVVTDVEQLDRSLAMWRQFTVWLGGMGIIVLALAILPRLRVGGRQFFELEMAGPEIEPLTVSIREATRRFLVLYVVFTALEVLALALAGWTGLDKRMTFFDAVAHSFTTLGTGGFSTRAHSLADFGAASQWIVIAFLVLAGTNYALSYRVVVRRRPALLGRDEEFRLYVALLALGSLLLLVELLRSDVANGESAVRHAVFQAVSMMTTTGFASTDFNLWTPLAAVVIVGLLFFGASAGSTSGSIKVVRHVLIGRIIRRELMQTVHPELVVPIRLNGALVDESALRAVIVFVLLYVGVFALGVLGLMLDAARTGLDLTPFEATAAAATTLGNAGPAFGFAGPFGSFDPFGDVSKAIMVVLMWLGRLEIIPVAVLMTRSYWRR